MSAYTLEHKTPAPTCYTKGREGKKPDKIVIHWWGGWGQKFDNVSTYLSGTTGAKVSAHYVAQGRNADASVAQRVCAIVPEADTAWHAGNWDANLTSIGIECRPEAYGGDYFTVGELVRDIRGRWGNLPLREHNDFTSTSCPGVWDITQIDRLARGLTRGPCARSTWRGVTVCLHAVHMLDLWAAGVGNDILLTPLAGCGSYQTDTAASANTHAGGGAIDIDTRNLTTEQRDRIERVGRLVGFQIAWERVATTGLWTWHVHALDPHCPNLSKEAMAQCIEFGKGGDGLVGDKPDTGNRTNAPQLMRIYNNRLTIGTIVPPAAGTTTTLSTYPRSVASAMELQISASISPSNAAGRVQFNWLNGTQWIKIGTPVAVNSGRAVLNNRPSKDVTYRGDFIPSDSTKWLRSNGTLKVEVIDLAALRHEVDDHEARLAKLEAPKEPI